MDFASTQPGRLANGETEIRIILVSQRKAQTFYGEPKLSGIAIEWLAFNGNNLKRFKVGLVQ
jgi:hypothetical protein